MNPWKRQYDSHYLFQHGDKRRSLSVCQLEQLVVEGRGDEAFQGQPEVMGIGGQPLHQPPAQSQSLHTEGLLLQEQLGEKNTARPEAQRQCFCSEQHTSAKNLDPTNLWQRRLHKGEHRQHQVTGQQSEGLHAAAQSSLQSLRGSGSFYRPGNPNSLNQEAQTNPLVSQEIGSDTSPVLQQRTLHSYITNKKRKNDCSLADQKSTEAVQFSSDSKLSLTW